MAAEKKKPRNRRAHLRYFTPTVGGGYVYEGPLARCQNPPRERSTLTAGLAALWAVQAAAFVWTGVVPVPGMDNTFYVLLPWLGELIALVLASSASRAVLYLWLDGPDLRLYRYQATVPKWPLRAAAVAVFAALAALGEVLCLVLQGSGGHAGGAVLFLGCQAAIAAAALGSRRLVQKLRFEAPED